MTIEKDPPLSAAVGAIISERRKRMGLTQAQLAEHLDITQDSLSRMEKGIIAPKFSRMQLIADTLGCSVADLFRQQDEPSEQLAKSIAEKISCLPLELQSLVIEQVESTVNTLKKISEK